MSLLLRSTLRFLIALACLKTERFASQTFTVQEVMPSSPKNFAKRAAKTLPVAWVCFAVAYSLVPVISEGLKGALRLEFLPVAGIGIAAVSAGHVSGALALTGGALAAGEIGTAQGVFALILGSGLGTACRVLRQDAGYYFGLFSPGTAAKLLCLNLATILPLIFLNLAVAYLAL